MNFLILISFVSLYTTWWILYIRAPGYTKGNHGNATYEHAMERLRPHERQVEGRLYSDLDLN